MYGMSRENGIRRLTELLESLAAEEFFVGDGRGFHVTFSAGIAQCPDDGTDMQALYQAADRALYRAKTAGRACVFATQESGAGGH